LEQGCSVVARPASTTLGKRKWGVKMEMWNGDIFQIISPLEIWNGDIFQIIFHIPAQMSSLDRYVKLFQMFKNLIRVIQSLLGCTVSRAGDANWLMKQRKRDVWITMADDLVTHVLEELSGVQSLAEIAANNVVKNKLEIKDLPSTLRKLVEAWPIYLSAQDLERRTRAHEALKELNQINTNWSIDEVEFDEWAMESEVYRSLEEDFNE
jgi:hypothetical protein